MAIPLLAGCMPDRAKQTAANEKRLAAEGLVSLVAGDPAPVFTATASDGQSFSLPQAGKSCVLFFIPAIDTPNSSAELLKLSREREALAAQQIEVFGIAPAAPTELATYAAKLKLSLPLLSDSDLSIARRYGCAGEGARFSQRTLVCIRADGTVALFDRTHYWAANARKSIFDAFGIAPPPKK